MAMKTIFSILFMVLLAAGLAGCSSNAGETVTVTEGQAGQTVELQVGDTLVVALPGNLTTGYNWYPAPQDPPLLEQVGEPQATPASSALGAPATIALQFRAVGIGQTTLRLDYQRGWEEDVNPESSFEVTVVVR
jgi:predicted secreted protein